VHDLRRSSLADLAPGDDRLHDQPLRANDGACSSLATGMRDAGVTVAARTRETRDGPSHQLLEHHMHAPPHRPIARGFTLIELLIVVVIIGILAAIAIPKFNNTKNRANRSAGVADLRNLATAQEGFYADSDRYAALADTAIMRFNLSRGNSALAITLAGAPPGATGWNASLTVPGSSACGIFVGLAPAPTGMPSGTPDGVPVCWP